MKATAAPVTCTSTSMAALVAAAWYATTALVTRTRQSRLRQPDSWEVSEALGQGRWGVPVLVLLDVNVLDGQC